MRIAHHRRTTLTSLALAASIGGLGLAAPAAAHAGPAPMRSAAPPVTAQASTASVIVGTAFTIRGRAPAGSRVQLQRYLGRARWVGVGRPVATSASGAYAVRTAITGAGAAVFRVVATRAGSTWTSGAASVTGYAWFDLASIDPVDREAVDARTFIKMSGRAYPGSVHLRRADEGYMEWNIDRRCAAFRASFGMDDASKSGARGSITIKRDDDTVITEPVSLGAVRALTANVSGALRLRVSMISEDSWDFLPALGTPQVLCSKKPGA